MTTENGRDANGRFTAGHSLSQGHRVSKHGTEWLRSGVPVEHIRFNGMTPVQGATHFLIAANFAEEIATAIAENDSPLVSHNISMYADCQARLADLHNVLLGGGARPADWGSLRQYEAGMASIERALTTIANVLRQNRIWLQEVGVFDEKGNLRTAVNSKVGGTLKRFHATGSRWARGWAWIEQRKLPASLPDEIAAIVAGTSRPTST